MQNLFETKYVLIPRPLADAEVEEVRLPVSAQSP